MNLDGTLLKSYALGGNGFQASFGGKATIYEFEDRIVLQSYSTVVGVYYPKTGKLHFELGHSQTTNRHIAAFVKQYTEHFVPDTKTATLEAILEASKC